jgi:hypothetical protein
LYYHGFLRASVTFSQHFFVCLGAGIWAPKLPTSSSRAMFWSVVQPRNLLFPTVSALSSNPGGITAAIAVIGGKLFRPFIAG